MGFLIMQDDRKKLIFLGSSLSDLRGWPEDAKQSAGYQLDRVQCGLNPDDWAPLKTVGPGVREIRISEDNGWWRVVYVQVQKESIHVLHCFQKKNNKTPKADIKLAGDRLKELAVKKGKA